MTGRAQPLAASPSEAPAGRVRRLRRLLGVLPRRTLLDLAAAFELEDDARGSPRERVFYTLLGSQEVSAGEIVADLLSGRELEAACRRLGVAPGGRRKDVVGRRLLEALGGPWRPFPEAREIARSLGLASREEYELLARGRLSLRGQLLPADVPLDAKGIYAGAGWKSWTDWLGIEPEPRGPRRRWRAFREARAFVHGLRLSSSHEWRAYCRGELRETHGVKPDDVPAGPARVYRDEGWRGFQDWLGTGDRDRRAGRFVSFARARRFAIRLELSSPEEWRAFCRGERPEKGALPDNVPAEPARVYRRAWRGWEHWLGLPRSAQQPTPRYRRFEEARAWVRRLGLRSVAEWEAYARGERPDLGRIPRDVPTDPAGVYAGCGWIGFGDWLGTDATTPRETFFKPFPEARALARALGVRTLQEWQALCRGDLPGTRLPDGVPAHPADVYADRGWSGWGDWLGTGAVRPGDGPLRAFPDARAWARSLELRSVAEWRALCRGERDGAQRPPDVPANPESVYADAGWVGWGDWLGTGRVATRDRVYRPFEEARAFARSLGLRSTAEWCAYSRGDLKHEKGERPADVPGDPQGVYAEEGWQSWYDWLGTTPRMSRDEALPFEEARARVRALGLRNLREWNDVCAGRHPEHELPAGVPRNPQRVYEESGWAGLGDWLGTGAVSPQDRRFRPFAEARAFARSLGLRTAKEWFAYARGDLKDEKGVCPDDVPRSPAATYANDGWAGFRDWLGTEDLPPPTRRKAHRSFAEARDFAQGLGLEDVRSWRAFCRGELPEKGRRPDDVPANPDRAYARAGWRGWADFLGTAGHGGRCPALPFAEARTLARSLGLRTQAQWRAHARGPGLPAGVPKCPHRVYRGRGWQGWGDWLGRDPYEH